MIRFKLVDKAPILVNILGVNYSLPRFLRRDWVAWRAEEMAERTADATEKMEPEQRARVLLMYPPQPLTNPDMRRLVYTPEGTGRIFRTCAERAGVPAEVIAKVTDEGLIDELDLETICLMLASMANPDEVAKQLGLTEEKNDEQEADDPLAQGTRDSAT